MKNCMIKLNVSVCLMLFCLQTVLAGETDAGQVKTHLLETLQDAAVSPQQKMQLYIDLYDLSDDAPSKRAYIREALKLAVRLKDQTYIFETLDILCRSYKDEADSLNYFRRLGEEHLTGPHKNFYLAWLMSYPSVCKMDEAEKPDEANAEITRYKQHKVDLTDKAQEVQWEMILCSAMECIEYFSPSVSNSDARIAHLQNIRSLTEELPFEVRYKFEWYYLTRIEFIYRTEQRAKEAVEALEQLEQLYDAQFEQPFYQQRAYLGTSGREALRMGVYSEMFYFGEVIGRERADKIYSRMEEYYRDKSDDEIEKMFLPSAFYYYLYTRQYDLAMKTIDELLQRTDSTDTNLRTELLAKKIDLVSRWKQHYKEGFDAFWQYTNLMDEHHVEETNEQLAEMRSLYEVDKLKLEQGELQARYHRIALGVMMILLVVFFVWGLYQYRLTKRLQATKLALLESNKQVAAESERAKASDRMKTEFLQSMCHEIRTPLNAICGFSNLLLNKDIDVEEKKDFPGIIEKSSHQLTDLFEDILQVAELSSSFELFPMEKADIRPVCAALLDACRERVAGSEPACQFESDSDTCFATTNLHYLCRIVEHLLNNALKFTASGTIRLSLSQVDGKVRIAVTDTGVGIPADKAEYIFDRFTKLDEFVPGTGLGLYSCRLIAVRLGASVYLDTSYQEGARFCIDLPAGA